MLNGSASKRLRKLFFAYDFIERNIRLTFVLVLKHLVKRVEASATRILFNLAVPSLSVKVREPCPKSGKVVC